MALIKCPECGKEVSDKAKACPNCGYPIASTQDEMDESVEKGNSPGSDNKHLATENPAMTKKKRTAVLIAAMVTVIVIGAVFVVLKNILSETKRKPFKTVGNIITFGTYPQTAEGNDSTPIEWLVLEYDAKNNRALLISRYGLDAQPYNEESKDITWEESSVRSWLNSTFMNKAFSAKEQSAIVLTNMDNSASQGYSKWSTSGGNNTQDKIFLLSYAEANKYLGVTYEDSNNTKSRVAPTAYAKKQGAYSYDSYKTTEGSAAGCWWLRSPGRVQFSAECVDPFGSFSYDYVSGFSGLSCCVRPALWINLESGIF